LFTSRFSGCRKEEIVDGIRIIRDGGKLLVYLKAQKYYRKYFSKDRFDVVVDEINTRPFMTPRFINNGERIVALIHQLAREYWFYETPFPISHIGYYILEEKWLKNYVNIPTVTVSESTKKDLTDLGFKEVHIVSEGLNFNPLTKVPEKESYPVIAYAGRLKKAKRPDHAIKAFKLVKKEIPEAELWIIGDGYFKKNLEKMINDGVKFYGGLPNTERRKILKKAWVLVNPSVREGFGLNIIEANALGVPCVVYNVPGLRDAVVDGETGVIVKSGGIESLAKEIIKVLMNEELRLKLSKSALAYSRKFSWDKASEEFMRVIRKGDGDLGA